MNDFAQDLKEMSTSATAKELLIPIDRAFRSLKEGARPGFTGQVRVPISIRQEAALAVEFGPAEITESQRVGAVHRCIPDLFRTDGELTERELKVKKQLQENRFEVKLILRTRALIGHFKDGEMNGFDLEMVGQ